MTPRQRYFATLEGRTPDVLPRIPLLMQFAAEYIGSNYGAFASDHRVLVEANIRCAEDFGLDQVSTISDPYRETAGFGAEIRYHRDGVPECLRPPLAHLQPGDDLSGIAIPDPQTAPRMKDRIDAIHLYRERTGDHYSILGWVEGPAALCADLRGLSEFLMDIMEEPEWTGRIMDLCTDAAIRFALAQIEAGADTIGIGDAICSQVSGTVYSEHIWPRQLRLMQAIRGAGARVRLHICGQTRHLWHKIKDLPVDILDCDHMVDLSAARATLPPGIILAGNLNPVADLRFGDAKAIPAALRSCARVSGPNYMVCAGCEIPSGTPLANVHAFCQPLLPPW